MRMDMEAPETVHIYISNDDYWAVHRAELKNLNGEIATTAYTRSDLAQKRIEELQRQGYILAMRVMGSDLVTNEEETAAMTALANGRVTSE